MHGVRARKAGILGDPEMISASCIHEYEDIRDEPFERVAQLKVPARSRTSPEQCRTMYPRRPER
jgi:hypothetical protein